MDNIGHKIKKAFSFFGSKLFYFILGLSLALNIFVVKAAWNTTVGNSTPLTPTLWNDLVAQVGVLTSRPSGVSSFIFYNGGSCPAGWTFAGSIVTPDYGGWPAAMDYTGTLLTGHAWMSFCYR